MGLDVVEFPDLWASGRGARAGQLVHLRHGRRRRGATLVHRAVGYVLPRWPVDSGDALRDHGQLVRCRAQVTDAGLWLTELRLPRALPSRGSVTGLSARGTMHGSKLPALPCVLRDRALTSTAGVASAATMRTPSLGHAGTLPPLSCGSDACGTEKPATLSPVSWVRAYALLGAFPVGVTRSTPSPQGPDDAPTPSCLTLAGSTSCLPA